MSSLLVFNKVIDCQSCWACWYFQPLLWTSAPLAFSLDNWMTSLLPPSPVCISTGVCIHTVCNGGGGRNGGLRQINTCRQVPLLVIFLGYCVFVDIWSMLTKRKTGRCVPPVNLISWLGNKVYRLSKFLHMKLSPGSSKPIPAGVTPWRGWLRPMEGGGGARLSSLPWWHTVS